MQQILVRGSTFKLGWQGERQSRSTSEKNSINRKIQQEIMLPKLGRQGEAPVAQHFGNQFQQAKNRAWHGVSWDCPDSSRILENKFRRQGG